jgi:hypothetical protein
MWCWMEVKNYLSVSTNTVHIIGVIALTFAVWLTVDVCQVVAVPFVGFTHWIPELCGIFLLSSYIAKNFLAKTRWSIFACTIACPIVCYQSTFGLQAAAIFGTAMLIGFLSVDVKKYLAKRRELKKC